MAVCGLTAALALGATACSGSNIPDPTSQDYANQVLMQSTHPGMDCVMEWVGQYVTNCYPMTYHPPYSVRVYFPKGCTCPPVAPRPQNYTVPRPIVVQKNTNVTINQNTQNNKTVNKTVVPPAAKPAAPQDKIPPGYRSSTTSRTGSRR
jgi:hypothetical protein